MNVPRHHHHHHPNNIIVAWLHYFLLWSSCLFFPRSNIIFASSSTSSSSSVPPPATGGTISNQKIELPSWLSHVNNDILNRQKVIAKEKHKKAIQTALDHYPTDTKPPTTNNDNPSSDTTTTTIKFDTYKTTAPGKLPDFHEELGSAPIFVTQTPLFSKDECRSVIQMAEDYYTSEQKEWPQLPSGQYYIQGFWIKDVPAVREWFTNMCRDRLFPLLQQQFPDFIDTPEDLVVDQAYLFKYIPQPGLRTEIHTDAGCLSFTFSLNPKEEYEGGGTWVEGLEVVSSSSSSDGNSSNQDDGNNTNDCTIEMDVGQCTVRPGGIRHCGKPLTKGTRYIIGGFCMSKKRVETVRQLLTTDESVKEGKVSKESLEAAIHLNPEYDGAYPELAHHYEQLEGNKEQSITILKDCLRLANPESSTANYYLGTHYYHQGTNLELARRHLEACLQIDPTDGDAMNTLAQIHAQLGHSQQEEDLYRRIVITPGVSKRILSNAYCNLGTFVASATTSIDEEMNFYQKSLEYEPTNVAALQSLGSAYASQNNWKQAIHYYQRAVPLEKDDTTCLTLLYKAVTMQLRLERQETTQSPPLDREGMMKRLGQLMGESNLQLLQNKKRETTG